MASPVLPLEIISQIVSYLPIKQVYALWGHVPLEILVPPIFHTLTVQSDRDWFDEPHVLEPTGQSRDLRVRVYIDIYLTTSVMNLESLEKAHDFMTYIKKLTIAAESPEQHSRIMSVVPQLTHLENLNLRILFGNEAGTQFPVATFSAPLKNVSVFKIGGRSNIVFNFKPQDFPSLSTLYLDQCAVSFPNPSRKLLVRNLILHSIEQLDRVLEGFTPLDLLTVDECEFSDLSFEGIEKVVLKSCDFSEVPDFPDTRELSILPSEYFWGEPSDTFTINRFTAPHLRSLEIKEPHEFLEKIELPSLETLRLHRCVNEAYEEYIQSPELKFVEFRKCKFKSSRATFPKATSLEVTRSSYGFFDNLDIGKMNDLTRLCGSGVHFENPFQVPGNLKLLNLQKATFPQSFFSNGFESLKFLDISFSCLRLLEDLESMVNLEVLIANGLRTRTLKGIENLRSLSILNVSMSQIESFTIPSVCPNVKVLTANGVSIEDLKGIECFPQLESLSISGSRYIKTLNGDELRRLNCLRYLKCGNMKLDKIINFSHLGLVDVFLAGNLLSDLSQVHDLPNLRSLDLAFNKGVVLDNALEGVPKMLTLVVNENVDIPERLKKAAVIDSLRGYSNASGVAKNSVYSFTNYFKGGFLNFSESKLWF